MKDKRGGGWVGKGRKEGDLGTGLGSLKPDGPVEAQQTWILVLFCLQLSR